MSLARLSAGFCIVLGLVLVLPQVVADDPWQLGFCGGLLLLFVALLILADDDDWWSK